MAGYASYRHIELDNVGNSKKRVRNPPSDILKVLNCSTPGSSPSHSPSRKDRSNDSFNRLFGALETSTPRKSSFTKHEISPRNPVTGDGVVSWDSRPVSRNILRPQRNPVTGEIFIASPTKAYTNGYGESPMINGKA